MSNLLSPQQLEISTELTEDEFPAEFMSPQSEGGHSSISLLADVASNMTPSRPPQVKRVKRDPLLDIMERNLQAAEKEKYVSSTYSLLHYLILI